MMSPSSNVIRLADYRADKGAQETETANIGQERLWADTIIEAERLVLLLLRECDDLDNFLDVLHTLSRHGVQFADLPAEPMVLVKWAKQFRSMEEGAGSDQS